MSFTFVPDKSPASKKVSRSMFWTEEHDIILCREILAVNPFSGTKKGTMQRGGKWNEIVKQLLTMDNPKFKVDQRSVRERYNLLSQKFKKREREEQRGSGMDPPVLTEVEVAVEDLIEREEEADHAQQGETEEKKKKMNDYKIKVDDLRKKAMETLGTTQKRKAGGNGVVKKKRGSTGETVEFMVEKNKQMKEIRKQELEVKNKEIDAAQKRHEDMMALLKDQQQQQQKQAQDFQAIMLTLMAKLK